jgi:Single-strand binding protein family
LPIAILPVTGSTKTATEQSETNQMEVKAMAINKVIMIGNLGADPVVRALASGQNEANFSLATTECFTDRNGVKQQRTKWLPLVVFGRLAETCAWLPTSLRRKTADEPPPARSKEAPCVDTETTA